MAETVLAVKARLRDYFLGRFGIHGIGAVTAPRRVIRVYLAVAEGLDLDDLRRQLGREALPYPVELVPDPPARLRDDPSRRA